jgi:hypothetical protein
MLSFPDRSLAIGDRERTAGTFDALACIRNNRRSTLPITRNTSQSRRLWARTQSTLIWAILIEYLLGPHGPIPQAINPISDTRDARTLIEAIHSLGSKVGPLGVWTRAYIFPDQMTERTLFAQSNLVSQDSNRRNGIPSRWQAIHSCD